MKPLGSTNPAFKGTQNDIVELGIYNPFIYVDPAGRASIAKISANCRYGTGRPIPPMSLVQ